MTDLDRELADRLGRLAAAVPVRSGQLDPVHAGAVAARQRVRMAWLTPLVALIVLVLLATLLGAGASNLFNGPISSTTRVGDFVLTFTSARASYADGEAIDLSATLTYDGPDASVRIAHAHLTPLGFGIIEPINGIQLSPGWRLSCEIQNLTKGISLERGFRKSGGDTSGNPAFIPFMNDPELRLPAGTWHPFAVAEFALNECGGPSVSIRADLAITVEPRPATVAPTFGPDPTSAGARWRSTATSGDFELELAAAREQFSSSEPLDVVASLTYRGPSDHVRIGYLTWGPIEFSMVAPGVELAGRGRWTCDEVELRRDEPMTEALADLETGRPFAVRHGLHTVSATASFSLGGCSAPMVSFDTSIVVAVSDGPDDIPLLTDESDGTCTGLLLINGGTLVRTDSGLGVVNGNGERRDVVWPPRYSARQTTDGAALFGPNGKPIAHEGAQVRFDAWTPPDGPLRPCGEVRDDAPDATPTPIRLLTADVPTTEDGRHVCLMALATGWITQTDTGIGLRDAEGHRIEIIWPTGYTGWIDRGEAVVWDTVPQEVAREGDYVTVSGGFTSDSAFRTCGGIQSLPRP